MTPEEVIVQLKSLVNERRAQADFFELAVNLYETGYKTDVAFIDAEVQKKKDEVQKQVDDLQTALAEKEALVATLQPVETVNLDILKP